MGVIFKSNVDGEDDIKHLLLLEDFEQALGYSLPTLIELMGIPRAHAIEDVIKNASITIKEYRRVITVEIHTTALFARTYIMEDGKIEYDYLRISEKFKDNGYGKSIFYTGVETAQAKGFKEITFLAFGDRAMSKDPNEADRYFGYATWIDPQIEMREDSWELYQSVLTRLAIPVVPLHELVNKESIIVHSPLGEIIEELAGMDFWIKYGFSWYAKIDLSKYVPMRTHKTTLPLIKVVAPKKENKPL